MDFEQFKECIVTELKKTYPDEAYEFIIRRMVKNNGMYREGLCIFKKGGCASPTIYLEPYFERYRGGAILADILSQIGMEYEEGMKKAPEFRGMNGSYEVIRDQIVMRLVNYEKNREILEECPHIRYHDLAVTFRWLAHQDEIGISSALITNTELDRWGITVERLYEDASDNTPRLFPFRIERLRDMLDLDQIPMEQSDFELFVLTNEQGINGATCILYDYLLDEFGAQIENNFYVLPSSIHEMMLCPDQDPVTKHMLLALVGEANRMVVSMGEVLSDNIYYYNISEKRLYLIENLPQ